MLCKLSSGFYFSYLVSVAASSLEVVPVTSDSATSDAKEGGGNSLQSEEIVARDNGDGSRFRVQLVSKGESTNSSSVHPVRTCEEENLDYDSTSSFEFHKGERSLHHSLTRSFSRPMSSKWNDAEKWIMNKQNVHSSISKKANLQNQVNRASAATNMGRVAPESTSSDNKASVKRVDFCQPSQTGSAKFGFASHGAAAPISGQVNSLIDLCPESKDLTEVDDDDTGLPCTKSVTEESTGDCLMPYTWIRLVFKLFQSIT